MARFRLRMLVSLLVCACGSPTPPPEPGAGDEETAPMSEVASCEPVRAPTLEALCEAWEQARRAELPAMRDVRCAREPHAEPIVHGAYTLSVIDILYRVRESSHGERYVVLASGDETQVVGRLNEMFEQPADGFVGLQRRELRGPDGEPPIVFLEGVTREREDQPCVSRETRRRQAVSCASLAGGYRCITETISETITEEISGTAHPMSSQYDYDVADRCAPVLERLGLDAEHGRRERQDETRAPSTSGPIDAERAADLRARLVDAGCTTAF